MSDTATATCECDGSGAIMSRYKQGEWSGYTTRLCECRKALPPREGSARWWTMETVLSETVGIIDPVMVRVRPEVPVSDDNYRVVMFGNRYYPTTIDLSVNGGYDATMHAEEARALAVLLIRAADAADAIDQPCTDPVRPLGAVRLQVEGDAMSDMGRERAA